MANRWGNNENSVRLYFLMLTANGDCSHEIKRNLLLVKKSYDKLRQHMKKQTHYFANKSLFSQRYGFSSSHVWMWKLDYKESWAQKILCFWTAVLEKTLESPLDWKEIQPVNPKGNQPWIFTGRTDAETPTLWLPDVKSWLIRKDWCWERLKTGGEGGDRGWDGWIASPTQWTWVWIFSFYLPWSDGTRFHDLRILNIEF